MRYCKCKNPDPVEHHYYKQDLSKIGEQGIRLRIVPRQDWDTEKTVKVIKCDLCKGIIQIFQKDM